MRKFSSTPPDNNITATTFSVCRDSGNPNQDTVSSNLPEARYLSLLIDDIQDSGLEVLAPIEEQETLTHHRTIQEDEIGPTTYVIGNPKSPVLLSSFTALLGATLQI